MGAREVPDGFVFSVKGPRFRHQPPRCWRRPAIPSNGFMIPACWKLGDRLGPVLWQFRADQEVSTRWISASFLELLPRKLEGRKLAPTWVEVRNDSFWHARFHHAVATVRNARRVRRARQVPGDRRRRQRFRLRAGYRKGSDEIKTCYPPKALDAWAKAAATVGPMAVNRTTCRVLIPQSRRKSRATSSPM